VLRQYISRFPQASVLVIGDLILDHYIWGRVSRISPEAPVPVVHVDSESLKLGGAANVFNNILAWEGKRTSAASSVRMKAAGCSSKSWIDTFWAWRVVIDQDRPTTRKSRVIAHNQQIVRYDVERRAELKPAMQRRILRYVESRLRELSCLVVSDYAKGVVSATLMSELTRLAALRGIPLVVDPKVEHFSYYKGATIITPNYLEATQAAGVHGDDDQASNEAGAIIRQRLGCQAVLVTRGEKGMSLYEERASPGTFPHTPAKYTMSPVRAIR